jgi:hypothetical protein
MLIVELVYGPAIPLPGIHLKESELGMQVPVYTYSQQHCT